MGLDIYAGTLTRYYAHNWKTAVQQWAEENGYTFSRIIPDGNQADGEEKLIPEEIQEVMESWRDQILAAITPEGKTSYAPWTEDNETPYYTDKPDWDAFGALLLYAASAVCKEPLPLTVKKDWDYERHPLIQKMISDKGKYWSLFAGAAWWLPIEDSFYFTGPLPTDDEAVIATTAGLQMELKRINELGWQADEETILSWKDTEGYPIDGEISESGIYTNEDSPEYTEYDTESLAKYAFSILWRAVKFSMEKRVPVLLDY